MRLIIAPNKIKFILSLAGIIDLISVLPFYLNLGSSTRALRITRLFRIFGIFKLSRYNKAMERFQSAFLEIKEELVLFFFASLILIYLVSVGIYFFENESQPAAFSSIVHSFWWSVVTLTTVGYGDVYPVVVGSPV